MYTQGKVTYVPAQLGCTLFKESANILGNISVAHGWSAVLSPV